MDKRDTGCQSSLEPKVFQISLLWTLRLPSISVNGIRKYSFNDLRCMLMQWSPVSYQLNAMCSCSFLCEDSSNDSHTKAKKFIFNLKTLSRRGVLKIDKEGKANAIVKQWAAGVIHCVLQESRSPAALSWGPFVCLKTLKFRFWTLDESQMMRTFSPKFSSEVWFRTTCGFSLPHEECFLFHL